MCQKLNILYISPVMPYDNIGHAGGKTFNYYLKHLSLCSTARVSVLCFAKKKDLHKCDLSKYNIDYTILLSSGGLLLNIRRFLVDIIGKITRHNENFSYYKKLKIMSYLKKMAASQCLPQIIILEWTNFVLMANEIKTKYPHIKIIASEHDVSFLGSQRKYMNASGINRLFLKKRYHQLRDAEIRALQTCDIIMPQNYKDKRLLIENGIESKKIHVLTPFFHDMKHIERTNINNDILFWGAMYRKENYEAAIWFIDNVMPLLEDTNVRFVIVGNNPPQKLYKKQSDRIIITGYVEDETIFFSHSLCFVSPLLLGAGIKVKIIEALSSGIPVLTNDIGIEGIPAKKNIHYFHCNCARDYALVIKSLINNSTKYADMFLLQRKLINKYFNLDKARKEYIDVITSL